MSQWVPKSFLDMAVPIEGFSLFLANNVGFQVNFIHWSNNVDLKMNYPAWILMGY